MTSHIGSPDYTVGPGVAPSHPQNGVVGFTTDGDFPAVAGSPSPEVNNLDFIVKTESSQDDFILFTIYYLPCLFAEFRFQ